IKSEFDEYGVSEDVLAELQNKWETKVIASHVAEFETPQQPSQPVAPAHQPAHHPYPPHAMHIMQAHYTANPYASIATTASQPAVKSEPVDNRYMLTSNVYIPALPGPNLNRTLPPPQPAPPHPGGQRMPQVDGPSESSGEEDSPEPTGYAPRPSHPSLPQPGSVQPSQQSSTVSKDDEAINSDLDDSDTENEAEAEEGGTGDTDIVFCTYDKVARVKNKWKCILKDGMIHINGKDYLFAKCTG
ncbi:Transcription initiation factor IIA large subunit, partial [Leucoagaricus sp. SymC.cos]